MTLSRTKLGALLVAAAIGVAASAGSAVASGNDWVSEMYRMPLHDGFTALIGPDGMIRELHVTDAGKMKETVDMVRTAARPLAAPLLIMKVDGKLMVMETTKNSGPWAHYDFDKN